MPAPKDKYAPIISEYYNMLDLWLTQMPLPTWKSTWFQGKALQASVFQSIIMYPFKAGTITKDCSPKEKILFMNLWSIPKKKFHCMLMIRPSRLTKNTYRNATQ